MDIKDFLPIVFERGNALQIFWNIQIVVTLGIVGFLSSAKFDSPRRLRGAQIAFTAMFVIFAISNIYALLKTAQEQRVIAEFLLPLITGRPDALQKLAEQYLIGSGALISPSSAWGMIALHLIADAFVLAVIWLLPKVAPPSR